MRVGFTGTQRGMSERQLRQVSSFLKWEGVSELHHGDCIGADEQAHALAMREGIIVVVHPPDDPSKRAFVRMGYDVREEKPYLQRNKDIVDETEMLIATPRGNVEEIRSGTWATVRYARKQGKRVWVVKR